MEQSHFTITPDELSALEKYITSLTDGDFFRNENSLPLDQQNSGTVNVVRKLLTFHKGQLKGCDYINVDNQRYFLPYLIEQVQIDHQVKILLRDQSNLMLQLVKLYRQQLELNPRHSVLNKSLAEMTGYDLYTIASYLIQDFSAK